MASQPTAHPPGTSLFTHTFRACADQFTLVFYEPEADDQRCRACGEEAQSMTVHLGAGLSVAFSPDGKLLATVGEDNTARLWDVSTGREVLVLTGDTLGLTEVASVLMALGSQPRAMTGPFAFTCFRSGSS